ncbi:MAG: hypothetical protein K2M97_00645 [Muribaculaceae bacterium]|nr:hypothetical protein [Muribaculaceae bacterium]
MKKDKNPLELAARRDGMTVPEGYFADFALRMEAALPEPEVAVAEKPRTRWQIIRPYAYLAAMFAGIWCMLQMFAIMGGTSASISPDSNPVLAEAIGDDDFMDDYYYMSVDEMDLMEDLYASGLDLTKF